jgi:phage gpG-like protein
MIETTITASPNLASALKALKPEATLRAVVKGMKRGTLLITAAVQKERLSGQGPFAPSLHRLGVGRGGKGYAGGRLRQSVRGTDPQLSGSTVTTSIGSNVKYAAAHEFGLKGTVKVRAHEVTMTKLFGRKLKAPLRFTRLASSRKVNLPERKPFRTGIAENLPKLEAEIEREVVKAMSGN